MDLSIDAFQRQLAFTRPPKTVEAYVYSARHFVRFVQEQRLDVRRAPLGLLTDFVTWLQRAGKSRSTVRLISCGALRYLKWRRARGDEIPTFFSPELPPKRVRVPTALTAEAQQLFRDHANTLGEPVKTALLLLPLCGCRVTEFVPLRLSQIRTQRDPETGAKQVYFAAVLGKGDVERDVPVRHPGDLDLMSYLAGWRAAQPVRARPEDWLWPSQMPGNRNVGHMSVRVLRGRMKDIRDAVSPELGLGNLKPHELRRTFASASHADGTPVASIAKALGHRSIQTTYAHYLAIGRDSMMRDFAKGGGQRE